MTDSAPHTGPTGRQDPNLPQVFGRYLLVQRLSRGGMGEIFLAKHGLAGFEKLAVIKKVLPNLAADQQFISRFVDEAQVAIKLQHVNVAQVFEVGRVGDEYFLALEYVEGRDLRRTLAFLASRNQRMPTDLALFIGRELANGLAYAHRRTSPDGASLNLVHCDISPPNVLVSFEGETKVIDFGIAKSRLRGTATDPKMGFGKFGYMAPEQLIRGGQVDYRTDLYAAGVVLFELLTGTRLYEATEQPDYRALARKVSRGEYPLPSEIAPELAPYDDLVATALRPKQEDRYQSAAELRDAIQQCLVAVNPTISTDQLGGFMRELFADEMNAQKELHERVAAAHLADFKEQMTTSTVSTVSFAFANMPLVAPSEGAPPIQRAPAMVRRPRMTTRSSIGSITPSADPRDVRNARDASARDQGELPAPDTSAPATTPMGQPRIPASVAFDHGDDRRHLGTVDLSLADGTDTALPLAEPAPNRRRGLIMGGSAIAFLFCGLMISRAMSGHGEADVPPPPPGTPSGSNVATAPPHITVEPIVVPIGSAGSATGSADVAAQLAVDAGVIADDPNISIDPPDPHPDHPKHPPTLPGKLHPDHPKTPGKTTPAIADSLTREVIAGRMSAAAREYNSYKAKYGMRLDREWGDLATFMNFQLRADNLDDGARRIEAFRAKMHDTP